MTEPLFRQQAVRHQEERCWAGFTGLKPVNMAVLTLLLLSLTITAGFFLASGEYRRKVVVSGIIVSDKGTVKIRAPASGIVEQLVFGQGERVGKGESLLKIRSGITTGDGGDMAAKLITENSQQVVFILQLIAEKQALLPLRLKQLESEIQSQRVKEKQLVSYLGNQQAVNALMHAKVERLEDLARKHHVSLADLESVRMEALQQKSSVYKTRMELENSKRLIEKTRHEKQLFKMEFNQQLAELEKQLSELRKQNLRLQGDQLSHVVSPVSGILAVVYPQQGQSVIERQPLFAVLQDDSLFEAQLYVPSRSVGFVERGLQVSLSLDAFPYQKFGMIKASVKEISQSVLLPDDLQDSKGMNEPYYRVTATLEQSFISAYGEQIFLRPGMQIKASIVLESRNLIEWILEPFFVHGALRQ